MLSARIAPETAGRIRLHDYQKAPAGSWRWWAFLGGRGTGKTLTGGDYVDRFAKRYPGANIGIFAPTLRDVRETCVLGPSGIITLHPGPRWNDKRNAVLWPNGTTALGFGCYSPEDVERIRGANFDLVWWDEFAAARYIEECFEMMDMALRVSDFGRPHAIFTSTPKPKQKLRELIASPECVVTKASTAENVSLTKDQRDYYYKTYAGTRLGRQELEAEILDDVDGALWSHTMIEDAVTSWPDTYPDLMRVVVAVDPAVTSGEKSDETGIIVVGRDGDGHGYVLEDCTIKGSPDTWATAAISAYVRHKADRIIGEVNNGGDLVEHTLRSVDPDIPYRPVRASRGKRTRAEPVAALYERRLVHHAPGLEKLQEEQLTWEPDNPSARSPNRMDALVWGMTELALTQDVMFNLSPDVHVMPLPFDASHAERVIEAWRFGWDKPTCIVWIAWTPGKPSFVIAEHEAMGEPREHAALARAVRMMHKILPENLSSLALPTAAHERNFAHEYAAHGIFVGENRNGPSQDARRARLARELNRRHGDKPAIVFSELCQKLQAQIKMMRFGDDKATQIPEDERGLVDALSLAITFIPEPTPAAPVDLFAYARENGIAIPGMASSIDPFRDDEQEIELWDSQMAW